MGLPEPIKDRLRNQFLVAYAQFLRDDLDDFTDGSDAVHCASVLSGRTSQVIIEIITEATKSDKSQFKSEIVLTNKPKEWLPNAGATITFEAPNRIVVTRPSEYFEEMLRWSNVQAWEDAGFIIGHILSVKQQ